MKMGSAGAAPGVWEAPLEVRWGCPRWLFFGPSEVEMGVSQLCHSIPYIFNPNPNP